MLIYLIANVPWNDLVFDLITFPLKIFPKVRSQHYPVIPNPSAIFTRDISVTSWNLAVIRLMPFYFPILIYTIAIIVLVIQILSKRFDFERIMIWGLILFLVYGMMLFIRAWIRPDLVHLLPTFIISALLFAVLLSYVPRAFRFRSFVWGLALLVSFFLVFNNVRSKMHGIVKYFILPPTFSFDLDRARMIRWDDRGTMYQEAIKYIQRHVTEGEKIFVGNKRHDQIVGNDVLFYFLSKRDAPTKYYELHPGLATTASIQKKIVSDIEMQHVKYIVLIDMREWQDPGGASRSRGSRILDNYIRDTFTRICDFPEDYIDYAIWKRRTDGPLHQPSTLG